MKICVDVGPLSVKGGTATYVSNVLTKIFEIDTDNEYFLYTGADNSYTFKEYHNVTEKNIAISRRSSRLVWDQLILPYELKKHDIDVMHGTKGVAPIFTDSKIVITIHDLIPILYPDTYTMIDRTYWRHVLPLFAKTAEQIITVSESTKNDLVSLLNIDETKVSVTPLGIDNRYKKPLKDNIMTINRYYLPDQYILYVGTLQPRKNLATLIYAFYKLKQVKQIKHKLVIVGKKGWLYNDIFKLVNKFNIASEVKFTGYVPDEDLPYLYNAADLFVYPSFYEGFGLPPLEAMACGTPVITSNTSSLPEVVGDAGIMVDPYDVDGLAQAMYEVLTNDDLREDLIKKGIERAKMFSWEKTARETLKVYESVVNGQ